MPTNRNDESFTPFSAALAFAIPGLGHLTRGQPRRALFIFLGVMGLFLGGIFIGGIDVVDSKEDFWWFVGQAGVGPVAFLVDRVHQNAFKVADPKSPNGLRSPNPDENPKITKSLAHPNEIGALYATIAGMLNVICVIDCLWSSPKPRRTGSERRKVVGSMEAGR